MSRKQQDPIYKTSGVEGLCSGNISSDTKITFFVQKHSTRACLSKTIIFKGTKIKTNIVNENHIQFLYYVRLLFKKKVISYNIPQQHECKWNTKAQRSN